MDEHAMVSNAALMEHIKSHVTYPASKAQILSACYAGELPDEVHKMAEMHLQDKTYKSADEVMKDLHMG